MRTIAELKELLTITETSEEKIEWNKALGYQAYPWYCNGELKKPGK